MYKFFYFSLGIIFFIASCDKGVNNKNDTIDISMSINKKNKIPLDMVAVNIEYIQLQSDTNCLIGRIKHPNKNVQFYDNLIFVADDSKILSFDTNGQFHKQFGRKGKGPAEYTNIRNYTLFPNKKQLAIFSTQLQKVLFFDFDGNFIKNLSINFWPTALSSYNDELVFINSKGRRDLSDYFTLSVVSDTNITRRLIYRGNEMKENIGLDPLKDNFYILNKTFNYWEYNYDTIWSFSNNFKLHSKRYIYYGKDKLPFKYIYVSNAKKQDEIKRYLKLWNYYETNRYMFFELDNKTKLNHIYYDKFTKESFNLQFKNNVDDLNFSFYNNIDGGLNFWPDGIAGDNKVFKIIYGYELKKHLEKSKNHQIKNNQVLNKKLLKLVNQSKMNDNPIIMLVTLKKLND